MKTISNYTQNQEYVTVTKKAVANVFNTLNYSFTNNGLDDMVDYCKTLTHVSCKDIIDSLMFMLQIAEFKELNICEYGKHSCYKLKKLEFRSALKALTTQSTIKDMKLKSVFDKMSIECVSLFTYTVVDDNKETVNWKSLNDVMNFDTIDLLIALMLVFYKAEKPVVASFFARYMYRDFDRFINVYE